MGDNEKAMQAEGSTAHIICWEVETVLTFDQRRSLTTATVDVIHQPQAPLAISMSCVAGLRSI